MTNLFIVCWLAAAGQPVCSDRLPSFGWAEQVAKLHATKESYGTDDGPRIYQLQQIIPSSNVIPVSPEIPVPPIPPEKSVPVQPPQAGK